VSAAAIPVQTQSPSVVKIAEAEVRAGHVFHPGHPRDYLFDLDRHGVASSFT
jgi:hypothetical protein